jgi:hypothetical protein
VGQTEASIKAAGLLASSVCNNPPKKANISIVAPIETPLACSVIDRIRRFKAALHRVKANKGSAGIVNMLNRALRGWANYATIMRPCNPHFEQAMTRRSLENHDLPRNAAPKPH